MTAHCLTSGLVSACTVRSFSSRDIIIITSSRHFSLGQWRRRPAPGGGLIRAPVIDAGHSGADGEVADARAEKLKRTRQKKMTCSNRGEKLVVIVGDALTCPMTSTQVIRYLAETPTF